MSPPKKPKTGKTLAVQNDRADWQDLLFRYAKYLSIAAFVVLFLALIIALGMLVASVPVAAANPTNQSNQLAPRPPPTAMETMGAAVRQQTWVQQWTSQDRCPITHKTELIYETQERLLEAVQKGWLAHLTRYSKVLLANMDAGKANENEYVHATVIYYGNEFGQGQVNLSSRWMSLINRPLKSGYALYARGFLFYKAASNSLDDAKTAYCWRQAFSALHAALQLDCPENLFATFGHWHAITSAAANDLATDKTKLVDVHYRLAQSFRRLADRNNKDRDKETYDQYCLVVRDNLEYVIRNDPTLARQEWPYFQKLETYLVAQGLRPQASITIAPQTSWWDFEKFLGYGPEIFVSAGAVGMLWDKRATLANCMRSKHVINAEKLVPRFNAQFATITKNTWQRSGAILSLKLNQLCDLDGYKIPRDAEGYMRPPVAAWLVIFFKEQFPNAAIRLEKNKTLKLSVTTDNDFDETEISAVVERFKQFVYLNSPEYAQQIETAAIKKRQQEQEKLAQQQAEQQRAIEAQRTRIRENITRQDEAINNQNAQLDVLKKYAEDVNKFLNDIFMDQRVHRLANTVPYNTQIEDINNGVIELARQLSVSIKKLLFFLHEQQKKLAEINDKFNNSTEKSDADLTEKDLLALVNNFEVGLNGFKQNFRRAERIHDEILPRREKEFEQILKQSQDDSQQDVAAPASLPVIYQSVVPQPQRLSPSKSLPAFPGGKNGKERQEKKFVVSRNAMTLNQYHAMLRQHMETAQSLMVDNRLSIASHERDIFANTLRYYEQFKDVKTKEDAPYYSNCKLKFNDGLPIKSMDELYLWILAASSAYSVMKSSDAISWLLFNREYSLEKYRQFAWRFAGKRNVLMHFTSLNMDELAGMIDYASTYHAYVTPFLDELKTKGKAQNNHTLDFDDAYLAKLRLENQTPKTADNLVDDLDRFIKILYLVSLVTKEIKQKGWEIYCYAGFIQNAERYLIALIGERFAVLRKEHLVAYKTLTDDLSANMSDLMVRLDNGLKVTRYERLRMDVGHLFDGTCATEQEFEAKLKGGLVNPLSDIDPNQLHDMSQINECVLRAIASRGNHSNSGTSSVPSNRPY